MTANCTQVNITKGRKIAIFLIGILEFFLGIGVTVLTTAEFVCIIEYVEDCSIDGDSDFQCGPFLWAWRLFFTVIGHITGYVVTISGRSSVVFVRHSRSRMGRCFSANAASSVVLVCCGLCFECFVVVEGYDDYEYDTDLLDKIESVHAALLSFYVALMILTISNIVLFATGGYWNCGRCCRSEAVGEYPNATLYHTSTHPEESQHTKGYSGPTMGTGPQHQNCGASSADQHADGPVHWHGAYIPQPNAELPPPPPYAPSHQYPDRKRLPD